MNMMHQVLGDEMVVFYGIALFIGIVAGAGSRLIPAFRRSGRKTV